MPRGYWRAIVTVVGLVLLGSGLAVTYQLYDASQQHHGAYDYQPSSKSSFERDVSGKAISQSYQPNCENPQKPENSNLCAQWAAVDQVAESNRMASLNLRFAIASLWATAIATAALIWTLIETRETARRELRAYLFVDTSNIIIGARPHNKGRVISIIAVKNSGSTPAHRVSHWSEVKIAEIAQEGEMNAPSPLVAMSQSTIPPGGGITADRSIEKPGRIETAHIKTGLAAIFIFGAIEYFDVFDRPHRTNYRLHFTGMWPVPDGTVMRFCTEGNDAT